MVLQEPEGEAVYRCELEAFQDIFLICHESCEDISAAVRSISWVSFLYERASVRAPEILKKSL